MSLQARIYAGPRLRLTHSPRSSAWRGNGQAGIIVRSRLKDTVKPPTVIAVSGFSSEVGKTTLMCELLRAFPGWEAIKVTRGHYRSCGRDPDVCCVSDLLSDQPVIRSGRDQNYESGKDTGRFWDAGASNVHWVIVTDKQVEQGISEALARVNAPGVFIEGNSILDFFQADFAVMVSRASGGKIKSSARRVLSHCSAIYLSDLIKGSTDQSHRFAVWAEKAGVKKVTDQLAIYGPADLPKLVTQLQQLNSSEHLGTSARAPSHQTI
jgi:hypothetical protein